MNLIKQLEKNLDYHFSEFVNMPLAKPYWIYISLSHKCNFNCQMCGVKKILRDQELEFGILKGILDEVSGWESDCVIMFTGGEPFLRNDIFKIISHSVSSGLKTEVVSNGSQINSPEIAERIIKSGLQNIAVSLDGAKSETHDAIRGVEGAYDMALTALRYLIQAKKMMGIGPQISVWTTIMKENLEELDKIMPLVKELGVECLVFHPVIMVQEDMQNTVKGGHLWIGDNQIDILQRQINAIIDYQRRYGLVAFLHEPSLWTKYFRKDLTKKEWKCNPFVFIDIGPDGLVRSCGPAFGNVKDMKLSDCLNTKEAGAARERMLRCQQPCLQTCWAWPEADHLGNILQRFIAQLDSVEENNGDKNKVVKEALGLLNRYEELIIHNRKNGK